MVNITHTNSSGYEDSHSLQFFGQMCLTWDFYVTAAACEHDMSHRWQALFESTNGKLSWLVLAGVVEADRYEKPCQEQRWVQRLTKVRWGCGHVAVAESDRKEQLLPFWKCELVMGKSPLCQGGLLTQLILAMTSLYLHCIRAYRAESRNP